MGTFMLLVGFGFLLEQIWYKSVMACVTIQYTVMRATVMIVPLDIFHRDSPRNAFLERPIWVLGQSLAVWIAL